MTRSLIHIHVLFFHLSFSFYKLVQAPELKDTWFLIVKPALIGCDIGVQVSACLFVSIMVHPGMQFQFLP